MLVAITADGHDRLLVCSDCRARVEAAESTSTKAKG
jgi:hypothetical protein